MSDSTRRGFLALAGAGAAAVGAAAVVSVTTGDRPIADRIADRLAEQPQDVSGPLVAWVGDVSKSEITLMAGDHEVVLTDADLVGRLTRAASQPAGRTEGA
jgi:hypothetical protein